MDIGTIIIGIVVIVAIAAFAKWYFKQTDDLDVVDDEPELSELDIGLDDRIRKMLHPTQEVDDDPYGENVKYPSYRATLVNRGIKEDQN